MFGDKNASSSGSIAGESALAIAALIEWQRARRRENQIIVRRKWKNSSAASATGADAAAGRSTTTTSSNASSDERRAPAVQVVPVDHDEELDVYEQFALLPYYWNVKTHHREGTTDVGDWSTSIAFMEDLAQRFDQLCAYTTAAASRERMHARILLQSSKGGELDKSFLSRERPKYPIAAIMRLRRMLEKYIPSTLNDAGATSLLKAFQGDIEELIFSLTKRFGPEPCTKYQLVINTNKPRDDHESDHRTPQYCVMDASSGKSSLENGCESSVGVSSTEGCKTSSTTERYIRKIYKLIGNNPEAKASLMKHGDDQELRELLAMYRGRERALLRALRTRFSVTTNTSQPRKGQFDEGDRGRNTEADAAVSVLDPAKDGRSLSGETSDESEDRQFRQLYQTVQLVLLKFSDTVQIEAVDATISQDSSANRAASVDLLREILEDLQEVYNEGRPFVFSEKELETMETGKIPNANHDVQAAGRGVEKASDRSGTKQDRHSDDARTGTEKNVLSSSGNIHGAPSSEKHTGNQQHRHQDRTQKAKVVFFQDPDSSPDGIQKSLELRVKRMVTAHQVPHPTETTHLSSTGPQQQMKKKKNYSASHIASVFLAMYDGKEEKLLEALVAKYGPEPEPPKPVEYEVLPLVEATDKEEGSHRGGSTTGRRQANMADRCGDSLRLSPGATSFGQLEDTRRQRCIERYGDWISIDGGRKRDEVLPPPLTSVEVLRRIYLAHSFFRPDEVHDGCGEGGGSVEELRKVMEYDDLELLETLISEFQKEGSALEEDSDFEAGGDTEDDANAATVASPWLVPPVPPNTPRRSFYPSSSVSSRGAWFGAIHCEEVRLPLTARKKNATEYNDVEEVSSEEDEECEGKSSTSGASEKCCVGSFSIHVDGGEWSSSSHKKEVTLPAKDNEEASTTIITKETSFSKHEQKIPTASRSSSSVFVHVFDSPSEALTFASALDAYNNNTEDRSCRSSCVIYQVVPVGEKESNETEHAPLVRQQEDDISGSLTQEGRDDGPQNFSADGGGAPCCEEALTHTSISLAVVVILPLRETVFNQEVKDDASPLETHHGQEEDPFTLFFAKQLMTVSQGQCHRETTRSPLRLRQLVEKRVYTPISVGAAVARDTDICDSLNILQASEKLGAALRCKYPFHLVIETLQSLASGLRKPLLWRGLGRARCPGGADDVDADTVLVLRGLLRKFVLLFVATTERMIRADSNLSSKEDGDTSEDPNVSHAVKVKMESAGKDIFHSLLQWFPFGDVLIGYHWLAMQQQILLAKATRKEGSSITMANGCCEFLLLFTECGYNPPHQCADGEGAQRVLNDKKQTCTTATAAAAKCLVGACCSISNSPSLHNSSPALFGPELQVRKRLLKRQLLNECTRTYNIEDGEGTCWVSFARCVKIVCEIELQYTVLSLRKHCILLQLHELAVNEVRHRIKILTEFDRSQEYLSLDQMRSVASAKILAEEAIDFMSLEVEHLRVTVASQESQAREQLSEEYCSNGPYVLEDKEAPKERYQIGVEELELREEMTRYVLLWDEEFIERTHGVLMDIFSVIMKVQIEHAQVLEFLELVDEPFGRLLAVEQIELASREELFIHVMESQGRDLIEDEEQRGIASVLLEESTASVYPPHRCVERMHWNQGFTLVVRPYTVEFLAILQEAETNQRRIMQVEYIEGQLQDVYTMQRQCFMEQQWEPTRANLITSLWVSPVMEAIMQLDANLRGQFQAEEAEEYFTSILLQQCDSEEFLVRLENVQQPYWSELQKLIFQPFCAVFKWICFRDEIALCQEPLKRLELEEYALLSWEVEQQEPFERGLVGLGYLKSLCDHLIPTQHRLSAEISIERPWKEEGDRLKVMEANELFDLRRDLLDIEEASRANATSAFWEKTTFIPDDTAECEGIQASGRLHFALLEDAERSRICGVLRKELAEEERCHLARKRRAAAQELRLEMEKNSIKRDRPLGVGPIPMLEYELELYASDERPEENTLVVKSDEAMLVIVDVLCNKHLYYEFISIEFKQRLVIERSYLNAVRSALEKSEELLKLLLSQDPKAKAIDTHRDGNSDDDERSPMGGTSQPTSVENSFAVFLHAESSKKHNTSSNSVSPSASPQRNRQHKCAESITVLIAEESKRRQIITVQDHFKTLAAAVEDFLYDVRGNPEFIASVRPSLREILGNEVTTFLLQELKTVLVSENSTERASHRLKDVVGLPKYQNADLENNEASVRAKLLSEQKGEYITVLARHRTEWKVLLREQLQEQRKEMKELREESCDNPEADERPQHIPMLLIASLLAEESRDRERIEIERTAKLPGLASLSHQANTTVSPQRRRPRKEIQAKVVPPTEEAQKRSKLHSTQNMEYVSILADHRSRRKVLLRHQLRQDQELEQVHTTSLQDGGHHRPGEKAEWLPLVLAEPLQDEERLEREAVEWQFIAKLPSLTRILQKRVAGGGTAAITDQARRRDDRASSPTDKKKRKKAKKDYKAVLPPDEVFQRRHTVIIALEQKRRDSVCREAELLFNSVLPSLRRAMRKAGVPLSPVEIDSLARVEAGEDHLGDGTRRDISQHVDEVENEKNQVVERYVHEHLVTTFVGYQRKTTRKTKATVEETGEKTNRENPDDAVAEDEKEQECEEGDDLAGSEDFQRETKLSKFLAKMKRMSERTPAGSAKKMSSTASPPEGSTKINMHRSLQATADDTSKKVLLLALKLETVVKEETSERNRMENDWFHFFSTKVSSFAVTKLGRDYAIRGESTREIHRVKDAIGKLDDLRNAFVDEGVFDWSTMKLLPPTYRQVRSEEQQSRNGIETQFSAILLRLQRLLHDPRALKSFEYQQKTISEYSNMLRKQRKDGQDDRSHLPTNMEHPVVNERRQVDSTLGSPQRTTQMALEDLRRSILQTSSKTPPPPTSNDDKWQLVGRSKTGIGGSPNASRGDEKDESRRVVQFTSTSTSFTTLLHKHSLEEQMERFKFIELRLSYLQNLKTQEIQQRQRILGTRSRAYMKDQKKRKSVVVEDTTLSSSPTTATRARSMALLKDPNEGRIRKLSDGDWHILVKDSVMLSELQSLQEYEYARIQEEESTGWQSLNMKESIWRGKSMRGVEKERLAFSKTKRAVSIAMMKPKWGFKGSNVQQQQ